MSLESVFFGILNNLDPSITCVRMFQLFRACYRKKDTLRVGAVAEVVDEDYVITIFAKS